MTLATFHLDPSDDFFSIRDRISSSGATRALLILPDLEDPLLDSTDLALLRRLSERERVRIALVAPDADLRRLARDFGLSAFSNQLVARRGMGWTTRPRVRLGLAPGEDTRPPEERPTAWQRLPAETRVARVALVAFLALVGLTLAAVVANWPAQGATQPTPVATIPVSAAASLLIQREDTPSGVPAAAAGPMIAVPGHDLSLEQSWEVEGTGNEAELRQQALLGLSAAAPELLAARLGAGEMLVPGSTVVAAGESSYVAPADGPALLRLSAVLTGTVITQADFDAAALEAVRAAAPAGSVVDPATVIALPGTYDPRSSSLVIGATGLAAEEE